MKKNVRSKNSSSSPRIDLDIAGFMAKIHEQLAALERKMEAWMGGQVAAKSFVGGESPKTVFRTPVPVSRPPVANQAPAQPQGHRHERRERVLHKAVCAECQKDCEVPFKPTGERPVYCKECFSKRKNGGGPKTSAETRPVVHEQRQIKVTPNGAGKVTVSEVVASSPRGTAPKRKNQRPAPKSKR